jgi:hypothetical protein
MLYRHFNIYLLTFYSVIVVTDFTYDDKSNTPATVLRVVDARCARTGHAHYSGTAYSYEPSAHTVVKRQAATAVPTVSWHQWLGKTNITDGIEAREEDNEWKNAETQKTVGVCVCAHAAHTDKS